LCIELLKDYRDFLVDLGYISWEQIPQVFNSLPYGLTRSKNYYPYDIESVKISLTNLLPTAYFAALTSGQKTVFRNLLDDMQTIITRISTLLLFEQNKFKKAMEIQYQESPYGNVFGNN